jgi:hypothetical protein
VASVAARATTGTTAVPLAALARETILLDRPLVDVEVSSRWDALDVLSLVRRDAHIVQLTPSRWLIRVVAVGRDAAAVERDLAAIAEWAAARARGSVSLVVGERVVKLS